MSFLAFTSSLVFLLLQKMRLVLTSISSSMIEASPFARPNASIQTRRGAVVDDDGDGFGGRGREKKKRFGQLFPSSSLASPPPPSQLRTFQLELVALEHGALIRDTRTVHISSQSEPPRRRRRIERKKGQALFEGDVSHTQIEPRRRRLFRLPHRR